MKPPILLRAKLALMVVFRPWATIKMLAAENRRLVDALAEPMLTGMHVGNGTLDLGLKGGGTELLAGMFVGMLEKHPKAVNYVEVTFASPVGRILVTVHRPGGKTAHELLQVARAELAALKGRPL